LINSIRRVTEWVTPKVLEVGLLNLFVTENLVKACYVCPHSTTLHF